MLEMEEWLMLRDLHTQGLNISEISRKTGLDRKIVSKYLKTPTVPESKKRRTKESKLDNYKEYIITKLEEGPLSDSSRSFKSWVHRQIYNRQGFYQGSKTKAKNIRCIQI